MEIPTRSRSSETGYDSPEADHEASASRSLLPSYRRPARAGRYSGGPVRLCAANDRVGAGWMADAHAGRLCASEQRRRGAACCAPTQSPIARIPLDLRRRLRLPRRLRVSHSRGPRLHGHHLPYYRLRREGEYLGRAIHLESPATPELAPDRAVARAWVRIRLA